MADTEPVFLVNPYCDPVVIRINGRASYTNSAPLRDFFNRLIRQGKKRFIIDFRNCTTVDSTFLGIVAGAAMELQAQEPSGAVGLTGLGERNLELVQNLGLDRIVELPEHAPSSDTEVELGPDNLPQPERARMILNAHLNLVEWDDGNRARFQDVVSFLKNQTGGDVDR